MVSDTIATGKRKRNRKQQSQSEVAIEASYNRKRHALSGDRNCKQQKQSQMQAKRNRNCNHKRQSQQAAIKIANAIAIASGNRKQQSQAAIAASVKPQSQAATIAELTTTMAKSSLFQRAQLSIMLYILQVVLLIAFHFAGNQNYESNARYIAVSCYYYVLLIRNSICCKIWIPVLLWALNRRVVNWTTDQNFSRRTKLLIKEYKKRTFVILGWSGWSTTGTCL